jgi:hypothetical protein
MRELPDELARDIEFSLHEGGDMLILKFPPSLHGTEEMQTLDRAAKSHGAAFVSREGYGAGHYLVPKAKPKLPAAAANEATAKRDAASQAPPKPKIQKGIVSGSNVAAAKSEIPNAEPKTPAPQSERPAPQPPHSDAQPHSVDASNTPKPSPIARFNMENCMFCEDASQCDITSDTGRYRRAFCMQVLDLDAKRMLVQELAVMRVSFDAAVKELEKIASRPASSGYRRSEPQLPKERHERGGISWLYAFNKNQERYEKALETENKTRPAYAALKQMIVDAATSKKFGVVDAGFWCWLSREGDWIGAKPERKFENNSEASR